MENLFWKELHKNLLPYINKTKRSKRLIRNVHFSLHGFTDKIEVPRKPMSQREDFLSTILYNYNELSESLKRFNIISVLIKQYPKQSTWERAGLSKTVYLRYHYESFLNEAYLYRERMKVLLTLLKRKCKKLSLPEHEKLIENALSDFLKAISNVTTVRGYHVHQRRFKNSKIEQLADLEVVLGISDYYKNLRDQEYKKLRIKLSQDIKKFDKDLEKLQNITLNGLVESLTTLAHKYR